MGNWASCTGVSCAGYWELHTGDQVSCTGEPSVALHSWAPSTALPGGTGCPVWHSQTGLGTQYGMIGRDWAPGVAWPDRTGDRLGTQYGTAEWDWAPSIALLDSTGHPVWLSWPGHCHHWPSGHQLPHTRAQRSRLGPGHSPGVTGDDTSFRVMAGWGPRCPQRCPPGRRADPSDVPARMVLSPEPLRPTDGGLSAGSGAGWQDRDVGGSGTPQRQP